MSSELFDPDQELRVREGANVPHWFQPRVTYFVTFWTGDSLPDRGAGGETNGSSRMASTRRRLDRERRWRRFTAPTEGLRGPSAHVKPQ
jgi:hypothetical protein